MLSRSKLVLAVSANIVGNALEWYEFYLYILFTPLFATLFFPQNEAGIPLIHTLFVFAIGFVSRPFGAIFFGRLGDRHGRRIALLVSILLMTIPTFALGFLPGYAQIGIAAPLLVALIRILQGVPAGGEFTGAMCYLHEISPVRTRTLMGSFVFFGSQIGAILSIIEFLLIEKFLPHEEVGEWGWRLSFIFGGVLGLGGWYLRSKLLETPVFEEMQREGRVLQKPVLETVTHHKSALLKSFLLSSLTASGWYLVIIFSPLYAAEVQNTTWSNELLITLALIIISNLFLPLFGWIADKGYIRSIWITSSFGVALMAYPFYFFGFSGGHDIFILLKTLITICLTAHFALLPRLLSDLFPAPVRYSGIGIGYNTANIIMGGASPFFALILTRITGNPYIPLFILIITALISLFTILTIRPQKV